MLNQKTYKKYVEKKSPKSNIVKDTIIAFAVGGGICVVAEIIGTILLSLHANAETVKIAIPVIMVFIAAVLTAVGVYSKLGTVAGAGSVVPITGFSNAVVSPAMEFKSEGWILGLGAKIFTVSGPVIAYGTITSIICGIIYYIINMVMH